MGDPNAINAWTGFANALAPWAAVILALLAYLQGRKNNTDTKQAIAVTNSAIDVNTKITKENKVITDKAATEQSGKLDVIHTLVNDMSTRGLGREANQAERIAGLTQEVGDQAAAIVARQDYVDKVATDAKADAKSQV